MKLEKEFFKRKADIVAKELLGKNIIRVIGGKKFCGRIVETEAYFGAEDPASRACKDGDLKETMKMEAGTILVYGVHNNWLINFVSGEEGEAEAVLIRALEPLNFNEKCRGPGLLTKALKIDKSFHKRNVIEDKEIWIEDNCFNNINNKKNNLVNKNERENMNSIRVGEKNDNFEIIESFRIGVRKDLERPLRFYIKENKNVSRK